MFRVAPVRTWEVLVGKYLAYGFLNLSIGALVSMLMVFLLKVPLLGSPREFAAVVARLTFASLGLGLLISILADSERQAVQLAMLVLLASVFLSGFVLPLDEFIPAVQWAAYVLPVTPAIQLLQNTMLRGHVYFPRQLWARGGLGAALFLFSGISLRRMMSATHT